MCSISLSELSTSTQSGYSAGKSFKSSGDVTKHFYIDVFSPFRLLQDSRARNARNGFEGAIIEKISGFFSEKLPKFPVGFRCKILGR